MKRPHPFLVLVTLLLLASTTFAQTPTLAKVSLLAAGTWDLQVRHDLGPVFQQFAITLAIADKHPTIAKVESENGEWRAKDLQVKGRRVRVTLVDTKRGSEAIFDGLIDETDATKVLGSFGSLDTSADVALFQLRQANRPKPALVPQPPAFLEFRRIVQATQQAYGDVETARSQSKEKQAAANARLTAAREREQSESPKLLKQLVAEHNDTAYGMFAVNQLLGLAMQNRLIAKPDEIRSWLKSVRPYAAKHGPRMETELLGTFANRLARRATTFPLAKTFAAEADALAKASDLPARAIESIDVFGTEHAAWATQTNPPPLGKPWTVTLNGRITDADQRPLADTTVRIGNTQWAKIVDGLSKYTTTTDADGRYSFTITCEGEFRLHVTRLEVEKAGFVKHTHADRHTVLPGSSVTINVTLRKGERFAGILTIPGKSVSPTEWLTITGHDFESSEMVTVGKPFTLTLPKGKYDVALKLLNRTVTWSGLETGATDHKLEVKPLAWTPELVGAGFDEMWKAMDRSYSYFTIKSNVDWQKLRDEYRPKALATKSPKELAKVLEAMLSHLKDGHVWVQLPEGDIIGTHRVQWTYNGNRDVIRNQLTEITPCGRFAAVGKTKPNGFGYFWMLRQSEANQNSVEQAIQAIDKLKDAPGFIIDLRNANGGSEPLARMIASRFCAKTVVYAKSKFRNGPAHEMFTEDYSRELPAGEKPFTKPVVCLLGPGCVSSGEGFAKMLAALPNVTTVGLPTRGSSGNPSSVEVGETGLKVWFSRWVDMMPDGTTIEGRGVPVKVTVTANEEAYKTTDPTLAKAIEVLQAKMSLRD